MNNKLLELIPTLPQDQLKGLKSKIEFCLQQESIPTKKQLGKVGDNLLLDTIIVGIKKHLKGFYFQSDNKTKARANEIQDCLDNYLCELLQDESSKKIFKVFRKKFYSIYVDLIINDLLSWDKAPPLNIQIVLSWYSKFAGLLDKAFPGYIESGLIKLIFNKEK